MDLKEFHFSCPYKVGIKDINYGGHVGNDVFLIYFQEARIAYLKNLGFSELDIGGNGIILAKADLEFKAELFHGEELTFYCRIKSLKKTSFIMEYAIEKQDGRIASSGETVLVSFNYNDHQISKIPDVFQEKVKELENI